MNNTKKLNNSELTVEEIAAGGGYALEKLDLERFPLVEDFEVQLVNAGSFGYHVGYVSETFGTLASFPWYDHVEQELKKSKISSYLPPMGTISDPYEDVEQSWEFVSFAHNDLVYILQGDFECERVFYSWFRVKKELYEQQWEKVINEAQKL